VIEVSVDHVAYIAAAAVVVVVVVAVVAVVVVVAAVADVVVVVVWLFVGVIEAHRLGHVAYPALPGGRLDVEFPLPHQPV